MAKKTQAPNIDKSLSGTIVHLKAALQIVELEKDLSNVESRLGATPYGVIELGPTSSHLDAATYVGLAKLSAWSVNHHQKERLSDDVLARLEDLYKVAAAFDIAWSYKNEPQSLESETRIKFVNIAVQIDYASTKQRLIEGIKAVLSEME